MADLDVGSVAGYLTSRGVLADSEPAEVREFSGGVSGVTLLVITPRSRVVVKQALPQLRVEREWHSDPHRAELEARALARYGEITPDATPTVLDVDPEQHTFTMTAAPDGTATWKEHLLAGRVGPDIGTRLGTILGRWHAATTSPAARTGFTDRSWFTDLRVVPFYHAVMEACPHLTTAIASHLDRMDHTRQVLVHGDFSPKNVLVHPDGSLWVVDFEVAHSGDPVFDLAFLLHHLLLKAIHLPAQRARLLTAATEALTSYRAQPGVPAIEDRYLAAHVGCLALARVLGTSPATYLTAEDRQTAIRIGTTLVQSPTAAVNDYWPERQP